MTAAAPAAALLLVGPTAAGKTPLGRAIAERGLWGRRWRHFDFGAELRAAAAGAAGLSTAESALVREVLDRGRLLEDHEFDLALKILTAFLATLPPRQRVVLNGLPRHVGQAAGIEPAADVQTVVELVCDEAGVLARIASNVGGDRGGRTDDAVADVRHKLALYRARTAPLVDHYRRRGAAVVALPIGPATTPDEAWRRLDAG